MPKKQEVTLEYINKLATQRKSDYNTLREEQKKDDELVEGVEDIGIKKPFKTVRTGKARGIIYTLAERIFTDNPTDVTEPRRATKVEEERNTRRKLWINARMNQLMQDSPNPIDENKIKGPMRGECFFKLTHNPEWLDLYYNEPKGKNKKEEWETSLIDKVPVVWSAPDPMVVYPSPVQDRGVPRDVIEIYPRTVEDVQASWPNWSNLKNRKMSETVEWREYWRADVRCFLADNEPVLKGEVQPNPYGFVPYVHVYAGFGYKSYEGKLETLARSLLYPLRDLLMEYQRMESYLDSLIALYAFHIIKVRARSLEEARAEATRTKLEPGEIWEEVIGSNGVMELEKLIEKGVEPPQSLFAYLAHIENMIEQRTFTSLLSGHASEGITSGVALSGRTDWARATYASFVKNLAAGLSRAVGMELRMIEKFVKRSVTIKGLMPQGDKQNWAELVMSPEDINGNYDVKMEFKTTDPSRDVVLSQEGSRLYRGKEISLYTNLSKYQGVKDPQAEMVRLGAERYIENSQMIQSVLDQKIAEDWGLEDEIAKMKEQEKLLKQTPTPQEVIPGMAPVTRNRKLGEAGVMSQPTGMEVPVAGGI
jgi:hypothetical protein